MKKVLIFGFILLVAITAYFAYVADCWFGVVAFTYGYLLFCFVTSLSLGALWFAFFKKHALLVSGVVFSLFAANYFLPPPSERLLRSALLKIPLGSDGDRIETIVRQEYEGSGYVIPRISKEQINVLMKPDEPTRQVDRVHFSLLSQDRSNVTAISFLIEDGVVVKRSFSPD